MIVQRLTGAINLRVLSVVVAAILGASALLVSTTAAGPLEDQLFDCRSYNDYKNLLDQGANVNAKNNNGVPSLILETMRQRLDIIKFLLERGADVNAKDSNGRTALMWAVKGKQAPIAKLLIEKGADVNAKDNFGDTVLVYADNDEIKRILQSAGAKPVKSAASAAAKEEVKESEAEQVSERAAKPAPKTKAAPRRPKTAGGAPRPPELPSGGALSGN